MRHFLKLVAMLGVLGQVACAGLSERSFYEGLRVKRNTDAIGAPLPPPTLPSYERYKQEREAVKQSTPQN